MEKQLINKNIINMKKVSSSALAKILHVNLKEFIHFLLENGFIQMNSKSFFSSEKIKKLTDKGKQNGGELKVGTKFGDYIVWPESFNPYSQLGVLNCEYISVTQLAEIFNISAKRLNMFISEIGWIESSIKGWKITKLGKIIGGKELIYDKTGKSYIKWPIDISKNEILTQSLYVKTEENPIKKTDYQLGLKKDKELAFRQKFPAEKRSKDGHMVRSRGEMLIDNALYDYGLVHVYERKVPINENMYSDFYIPAMNGGQAVYIEYWGYENMEEYHKRKEIKIQLYKQYDLNLIQIENIHIDNLDDFLPKMLRNFGINVE